MNIGQGIAGGRGHGYAVPSIPHTDGPGVDARLRLPGAGSTLLVAAAGAGMLALVVRQFEAVPVLGALLGLGAVLTVVVRPDIATVVTAFLLYINFPAVLTKQHGVPEFVAGSFILLLGFPIVHLLLVRRERLRIDSTFALMVAWLAVLLLSSLDAVNEDVAFGRVQMFLFEGLLLYTLVLNSLRDMASLRRTMCAVLAAGSLLGALSTYQEATGSYQQEFGGLAYRNYQSELDKLKKGQVVQRKWDRAQGPVDEPNRFAQILIVLVPLAVFVHRTGRSRAGRLAAAAAGAFILAGILLTLSRGAMVALVFMGIVMVRVGWVRTRYALACALALLVTVPLVTPFFLKRVQSIPNVGYLLSGDTSTIRDADGAIRGRATEMLAALHVFMDHPVLGVGPGQFAGQYFERYAKNADIKFRDIQGPRRAHTLYFETAAEVGLVGLSVFLAIIGLLMRALWQARQYWRARDPAFADLATALWLSLVAYLCTAVFLHLSYQRYYWFLLAIAASALQLLRPPAVRGGTQP